MTVAQPKVSLSRLILSALLSRPATTQRTGATRMRASLHCPSWCADHSDQGNGWTYCTTPKVHVGACEVYAAHYAWPDCPPEQGITLYGDEGDLSPAQARDIAAELVRLADLIECPPKADMYPLGMRQVEVSS